MMPVALPAIIMVAPDIPSSFRIEPLDVSRPSTVEPSPLQTDCSPPMGGEIVVCGRRPSRPGYRIEHRLPPSPTAMEDISSALIVRKGSMEFGVGAGTVYFKLKF